MVTLQCCIDFCCRAKWISYTYIDPLFWISFPFRPPQRTEESPLWSTVGSHLLSSLYTVSTVCICQCQSPNLSHPAFPRLGPYICSLCLCFYFCFANRFICTVFSRFHIYVLLYNICFTDLLDFVWQFIGPSMSMQMAFL